MGIDEYMKLVQVALETAIWVSAPILALGLTAGLSVSIFQAATQISDGALAFLPKIAAAVIGILVFGHFMISRLASFTTWTYGHITQLGP